MVNNYKKMKCKNKISFVAAAFAFLAGLFFLTSFTSAADPGHGAGVIGSGTFESGDYGFPFNVSIGGNFSVGIGAVRFIIINETGRIGVGTASPIDILHLMGGALRIQGNNSVGHALNVSGILYVNASSGNVGIGTTGPGGKLEVGSGQVLVPNGLQNAPSFSFSDDPDTGLYRTGGGGWGLSKDGTVMLNSFSTSAVILQVPARAGSSGDATTPYFSFYGDENIGMYRAAADTLAFSTAGSERLTINSAGNVGIGTTTPSAKLDVRGTGNFSGTIFINNATDISTLLASGLSNDSIANFSRAGIGTNVGSNLFTTGRVTGTNEVNLSGVMYVNSTSGNVGIGTASPIDILHLMGGALRIQGNNSVGHALNVSGILYVNASSGNVGIGTTSPGSKLHVYTGASGLAISNAGLNLESNTHQYLTMSAPANTQQGIIFNGGGLNDAYINWEDGTRGNYLTLYPGASNFISVQSGLSVGYTYRATTPPTNGMIIEGNVGIGTTTPSALLHVNGTGALLNITSGSTAVLFANSSGNVGIGTTAPSAKLDVQGNVSVNSSIVRAAGAASLTIDGNGGNVVIVI